MAAKTINRFRTSTPKKNSNRGCFKKIPMKFDEEDNLILFSSPPVNDDVYTPPPLSVFDVCKMNKMNSSKEKISTPQPKKACPEEYDPDNDVFIHGSMGVKFDADSLKSNIKRFMESAGVPSYKQAISNCFKKKSAGVVKRRSNKKRTPKKPEPEESDTEVIDVGDNPYYGRTPPGARKAMLYAKYFLQRIIGKRKYLVPLCKPRSTTDASEPSHALGSPEQNPNDGEHISSGDSAKDMTASKQSQVHRATESEILKGVVAYVDVICHDDEDISCVIRKELMKLGANVVPTFTKNDPVSVVLFNDGHVSTYQKAKKRGIPLVSVLWIEESRRSGTKAPMDQFPAYKTERYESPEFVNEMKKRKFLYAGERIVPRKTRKRARNTDTPLKDPEPKSEIVISELPPKEDPAPAWLKKYVNRNETMKVLIGLTGVTEEKFKEMMVEPEDSEKYELSPLPMRLLYRIAKDVNRSRNASLASEMELTPSPSTSECSLNDSESDSILTKSLNKESFEATEDDVQESNDGNSCKNKQNSMVETSKFAAKGQTHSRRPRTVKRKLSFD